VNINKFDGGKDRKGDTMKKKHGVFFGFAVLMIAAIFTVAGCATNGGDSDLISISTAEQFNAIRNQLDGHYVLEADIDLTSYHSFTPIGRFEPKSDAPEDEENPKLELTFTGSFDGKNHKISNINIEGTGGVGLFGCVAENGVVKNLVVENVTVQGTLLVGGVIGYGHTTTAIENVKLQGTNSITGNKMVGGIVGGGFCDIKNCSAEASVVMNSDNSMGVGILAGGMANSSIISCSAKGTVSVTGNGSSGIGGLAACGHNSTENATEITDCHADVTISVGENCSMIGGLVGYAGNDEEGCLTVISGCTAKAVITAPASAERIGGIVGSGFYMDMYKVYFPVPGSFIVRNSSTSGSISGGKLKGTIAGYIYNNSTVENTCISTITIDGTASANQVGGAYPTVPLTELN
jgi:hypothetical protein